MFGNNLFLSNREPETTNFIYIISSYTFFSFIRNIAIFCSINSTDNQMILSCVCILFRIIKSSSKSVNNLICLQSSQDEFYFHKIISNSFKLRAYPKPLLLKSNTHTAIILTNIFTSSILALKLLHHSYSKGFALLRPSLVLIKSYCIFTYWNSFLLCRKFFYNVYLVLLLSSWCRLINAACHIELYYFVVFVCGIWILLTNWNIDWFIAGVYWLLLH